ncbi:MAG: molybdenum cofactor guanylyltransferase MobA [Pseudomonadales bacterium]
MPQPPPDPPAITGVILCGGSGRRVGGTDKPLLPFHGRPLVDWVAASLGPQVGDIVLSANRNQARYAQWGKVVTDAPLDSRGPLTGILRALQQCPGDWFAAVPGDAPLLNAHIVARLALQAPADGIAVAHDGTRLQGLHLVLHRALRAQLEACLDGAQRSVQGWLRSLPRRRLCVVDCTDIATSFLNVNTPEDFHAPAG